TRLSTMRGQDLASVANRRRADPRKLGLLIRGDLDWIVMKALEKDRTRRYETANGLVADIHRFLRNEPVTAAAPSTAYRLRKFVRRNRTPVLAATAIVVLLVGGVTASSWLAVMATKANQQLKHQVSETERAKEAE